MKTVNNWDKIYWAIDLHDTLFKGKYASDQEIVLYPYAKEVLQALTLRKDTKLIAFTCSYALDFKRTNLKLQEKYGICFDYLNENPECDDTAYASFAKKPYFNILLDDKAGFDGEQDWYHIKKLLEAMDII